jgi:hypothetical protein
MVAAGAASAFPADAIGTEIGFVDFDLTGERRLGFAHLSEAFTDAKEDRVHGTDADAGQRGGFGRGQIKGEAPHQMAESGFGNLRTVVVLVPHRIGAPLMVSPIPFAS